MMFMREASGPGKLRPVLLSCRASSLSIALAMVSYYRAKEANERATAKKARKPNETRPGF